MDFIKTAKFISANPEWKEAVPKFQKSFNVGKDVIRAELQISALGVYVAELNGGRVGDFIMAPGWTEYGKRLQYQSYDVTSLIKADGENLLTVGVGHGWYGSNVGSSGKYPLGEYPALIAALRITYRDGEELITTDTTWLTAKSETLRSTIYGGEVTDARRVPNFTERARIFARGTETLIKTEGETVRETEEIAPREIITTPRGELVIDFGQNMTGYVKFKITGKAGTRVALYCAEILDKDGNFYNENYRAATSCIEYTLRDGTQEYKPLYTFFGFRYVKLYGWCEEVRAENFTAIVVHSDMKRTGRFTCGAEKVNRLYENVVWGQRGNFLDIPTDCPQRDERLGWTGDAQVFCRTAMLNYDCRRFFKKWLRDLKVAQYRDGGVPRTVPSAIAEDPTASVGDLVRKCSSAWGDAATVCPFEYYMAYGDRAFLSEMFPVMKKWVGFIEKYSEDYVWSSGFHFGDWLALDLPSSKSGATDKTLIATAFFYHSAALTAKAGRILGRDVSHLEDILPKIKNAFLKKYARGGRLTVDTQTAYALAIHFGLADGELKKSFGDRLAELISSRGDTLTTGFVGTPYLLDALTESGHTDKAYTLLLQEKFPSWLYSVNMGATTVWEHWDGINENGEVWSASMNSFNHYAYGSVAAWLYRTVSGIRYDEERPAYEHFFISPHPNKKLGHAKAALMTVQGEISVAWYIEKGDTVRYSLTIPKGTVASVTLGGRTEELPAGSYTRYSKL